MGYWSRFYKIYDVIWNWLPTIDPNKISLLIIAISLIYTYISQFLWPPLILVLVIWWLDWLDGVMARRLKKLDDNIEMATDRISELMLYSPYGIMISIVLINILLSVIKLKYKPKIPFILPLKQILIMYLVWRIIQWPPLIF